MLSFKTEGQMSMITHPISVRGCLVIILSNVKITDRLLQTLNCVTEQIWDLMDADVLYFTTKQVSMTKRLAACNPTVSQTYRPGASASVTSCCALLRVRWHFDHLWMCVCLHQFVTRHCSLLHLSRFNTAAYRFTLSGVSAGTWDTSTCRVW